MNLLTAENISRSFTEKVLFEDVSLGISDTDRIGLIGVNGTGKSTLLKVLAGELSPDSGKITKGNNVTIEYLPQNPVFDDELSVLQNVIKDKKPKKENWNMEGEARSMLLKLGIEDPDGKPSILSGGQRKRASLVRALLADADILILDEPTNHLDSYMSEWLEGYLKSLRSALVMITHDRYFLDSVTNRIIELDKGKLYSYQGGYEKFLELKAEREEMALATERKLAALYRKDLEWMMRGARARSTKQKAHIDRFNELANRERPAEETELVMGSVSSRLGRTIIEINGISKSFGDKKLFEDFSYSFVKGDRVGIVGHNGCGKSTLLKTIIGQITPDAGSITIGQTVKIGYFSQENEEFDGKQRVIDSVKDIAEYIVTDEGHVTAAKMLERFLFEGGIQYEPIEKLSGGERRRLGLLHILMGAPNVLILDEPTNDLDIKTLSILEDYLDTFNGIVITVSHDRYFLDRVAARIFAFEEEGGKHLVRKYEGGYSDYYAKSGAVLGLFSAGGAEGKMPGSGKQDYDSMKENRNKKLKFTYAESKEFETIDDDIEKLEKRISELDEEIIKNASDYGKLNRLTLEKNELEEKLDFKMERWEYLNELKEKIDAQQ